MRRIFHAKPLLYVFLLAGALLMHPSAKGQVAPTFHECKQARFENEKQTSGGGIDVLALRAEWRIDVRTGEIIGRCTYVFFAGRPIKYIEFDFSDSLILESASHRGKYLSAQRKNNVLRCPFSQKVSGTDSITISYRGRPSFKDLGTYATGTDSVAGPWMWTLSQPYGAADWFPVRQNLQDKIENYDAVITVDEPFYPVSNGVSVREERQDGRVTVEWRHRRPIAAYLIGVAAANYVRTEDEYRDSLTGRAVAVVNHLFPQDLATASEAVRRQEKVFRLFTALFGPYPFESERYGHVRFVRNGGMEHQTASFVGNFDFELLAHELAHQWFGNHVTCGSWRDLWLNEGFATYLTGLAYRFVEPEWWEGWKTGTLENILSDPSGSVYAHDTVPVRRLFSRRLRYTKAAYVLRTLEYELGAENFWAAVREYLDAYAGGFARTEDFRRALERATGKNLQAFFADWVYGTGYPRLSGTWSAKNAKVYLRLRQTTAVPEYQPCFWLKPQVRVYGRGDDGETVFRDFYVEMASFESNHVFDVDFSPDSVVLDPERYYILGEKTVLRDESDFGPTPQIFVSIPDDGSGLAVHTDGVPSGQATLECWGLDGKTLAKAEVYVPPGAKRIPWEGLNPPPGMYLLRITFASGAAGTAKFVRQ